ncbi:MAG: hypothetical protein ACRENT_03405 [Thermodesulfobacteriota bacterium]
MGSGLAENKIPIGIKIKKPNFGLMRDTMPTMGERRAMSIHSFPIHSVISIPEIKPKRGGRILYFERKFINY